MNYPSFDLEHARQEQLKARWQPKLVKQIIAALNAGQDLNALLKPFPEFNFLDTIDLRGIDFCQQHLDGPAGKGVDFSSVNLTGASFHQAHLENANFESAELTGVDFFQAKLNGANFTNVVATNSNFEKAELAFAKFNTANCDNTNFLEADFTGSDFAFAHARECCFRNAQLKLVNFSRATLKQSDFRNAVLDGTSFQFANLEECDLRGTSIEQANWKGVKAKTALLDPGQVSIHQPSFIFPSLKRVSGGLSWIIQHIGNLSKLILLITFIWLTLWIYHRISPPDAGTVEIIPFEVVIEGKPDREYGIYLTNKLIESRNNIFGILEKIQHRISQPGEVSDPALKALKKRLKKDENESEAELVLEYRSGEIVNQNLMLSNLSNYRRFEKYSFPLTDFQVLQFIFDLRRVKTTNPTLAGTFNRTNNQVKAVVRMEEGDRTLGIWALDSGQLDSAKTGDVSIINRIALQMVKDELGQQNPFFNDVTIRGFDHYLQGIEQLNQYLEIKKYQNSVPVQTNDLLNSAKAHFEIATNESFSFAPAFYYLGIVNFEKGKTDQLALEACIKNYELAWKLLTQQLSELAARGYATTEVIQFPKLDLYQETRENLTNTLYNLAQAYHFNSRFFTTSSREFAENIQSGIDFYLETMRFDTLNTNIYINLAEAYRKLKNADLAQSYYHRAILLGATSAKNYYRLGVLYAQEGGEKLEFAIQMLENAIQKDPENPAFYFTLGELYLKTARLDQAEKAFLSVYGFIEKNSAENYYFFGQKFFKDELYEFAARGFRIADSIFTEKHDIKPLLKFNLGLSLHHLKKYEAAIPYFKEAQRYRQFEGSASYNLACAYSQSGNIPEACQWLKLALQLDAVSFDMAELDDDLVALREAPCFKKLRQP